VVVSVTVDDTKIHDAITALETHNPIEIDERSDDVSEGSTATGTSPLTGPSTVGRDFSSGEVVQGGMTDTGLPASRVGAAPVTSGITATTAASVGSSPGTPIGAEKGEEVLPLAEERLEIGKRTVDRGTTRIRRYVVERPVEENVTLRGERVTVERRPVETATAPGASAFEERVVEVHETGEEPVVAKTARVVEEVVVGREATERTETVKDTVRREEVEVFKDGQVKP
jgi:uncharacterized protein (TIGR02271 family)